MQTDIQERKDGISLTKSFEEETYRLPSVVYRFESQRDEPVLIRVAEQLPDGLQPVDIGFHPDHGSDHWEVRDEEILFEYELESKSAYETMLAVRPDIQYDVRNMITLPKQFEVKSQQDTIDATTATSSFTRSASTDGGDVTPEEHPANEVDGDVNLENSPDKNGRHVATDSDVDESKDDDVEYLENADLGINDGIGEMLAAEIRRDAISEEAIETLQRELELSPPRTRSEDARIEQLQTEFADLRAYTSALEEFLNQEGSAEEVIGRFERKLDTFENELESVTHRLDDQWDEIDAVQDGLDRHDGELDSISDAISSVRGDLESLSTRVSEIEQSLPEDAVDEKLSAVEEEITEVSAFVNRLEKAFE